MINILPIICLQKWFHARLGQTIMTRRIEQSLFSERKAWFPGTKFKCLAPIGEKTARLKDRMPSDAKVNKFSNKNIVVKCSEMTWSNRIPQIFRNCINASRSKETYSSDMSRWQQGLDKFFKETNYETTPFQTFCTNYVIARSFWIFNIQCKENAGGNQEEKNKVLYTSVTAIASSGANSFQVNSITDLKIHNAFSSMTRSKFQLKKGTLNISMH